jgi:hypothetical protein
MKIELSGQKLDLFGDEREGRRLEALSALVAANTWSEGTRARAQTVPPLFLDALEQRISTATGGRKRTLLEVYDLMLGVIIQETEKGAL